MHVQRGIYPFRDGYIGIACSDEGICSVELASLPMGKSERTPLSDRAYAELLEFFAGERKTFDLPVAAEGTAFQKKVWDVICKIPYGRTETYGRLAELVGCPGGARAVGMACNRNPVPFIVPCHRVVGAGGRLVGYALGTELKAGLLKLERENL